MFTNKYATAVARAFPCSGLFHNKVAYFCTMKVTFRLLPVIYFDTYCLSAMGKFSKIKVKGVTC